MALAVSWLRRLQNIATSAAYLPKCEKGPMQSCSANISQQISYVESVSAVDSILQRSFVKCVRGEIAERGMHSVLNLQSNWTIPEQNQSFK